MVEFVAEIGSDSQIMVPSALIYLGHYETSFHRLHAHQDRYWRVGDRELDHPGQRIEEPPEKFGEGIQFGVMQTSTNHVIVRVDRLVLPAPVLFIGGRHGPMAPGPAWPELGREVTLNILADAIVTNPGLRDELIAVVCRVAEQSAASPP